MPEFSLAWNRRRLEWRHDPEKSRWQLECVLCERVLLEGRPQLRIVARLARGKSAAGFLQRRASCGRHV